MNIPEKAEFTVNKQISSLINFEGNDLMDNAQYLTFILFEGLGIKIENDKPLKMPVSKSKLEKLFINGKGFLLGSTKGIFGEVEYYLNGLPKIFTPTGEMICTSKRFETEINKDNSLLQYENKSYIYPKNKWNDQKYYGIFYSLNDAIKIVKENDFVKTEEITS